MSRKGSPKEDRGPGVPAYIVTFSDMVTLLLTFFVMLLSMAEDQSQELFEIGQTSFKRALADFGVSGFVVSKASGPEFDYPKAKHKMDEGQDEPEQRAIDPDTEMTRRVILELERTMKISPSQITGQTKNFLITDIHFRPDNWDLDDEAKSFLERYSKDLQESIPSDNVIIYVVGIASSEPTEKRQWIVSTLRSQKVAEYIQSTLPMGKKWFVFYWGAGNGGEWTGSNGLVTKETEIFLAAIIPSE